MGTTISPIKQEKISVNQRKTPEETKCDVISNQYWHRWVKFAAPGPQGELNSAPPHLLQLKVTCNFFFPTKVSAIIGNKAFLHNTALSGSIKQMKVSTVCM